MATFAFAFCVLAAFARLFSLRDPSLVIYWLPAGLYTAVLMGNARRTWPWFIATALFSHGVVALMMHTPWRVVTGYFVGASAQALFGAWLMRRFVAPRTALGTLREFAAFLGLAVLISPMVGTLAGALTLSLLGRADAFARGWEGWWVGQGLSVLVIGTTVLAWQPSAAPGRSQRTHFLRTAEAVVLAVGLTAVVCYMLLFDARASATCRPLLLVFALWAGVRFRLRGATALNLWFAALLAFLSLHLFRTASPDAVGARDFVLNLQAFLAMTALVSIVPAIALCERDAKVDELRESEDLFRSTLDALPVAAYTCDSRGRITYFNERSEMVWGRAPRLGAGGEQFCGSYRLFHVDGSPLSREQCWMAVALSTQRFVAPAEVIIERPDGSRRTVLAHASPLFDSTRHLRGVVNVLSDVTELKNAKQALLANEVLLRQFIKHAPAAVAMFDVRMRYLNASEQWVTQFNLDGHNLIGRLHFEVSPEVPERWREVHRRVLAGAVESCEEDSFLRPDGETEWLHWDARPWRTPDGAIGGLIMFTQVITERIKMKAALRASEERFRSAMHHSPIGMSLVGFDGQLLEVNPALTQISGYTRDELLQRHFQELSHPDDNEADLRSMQDLLERRRDRYQMEKRYVHKQGHIVWIQLSVSLIWNPDGSPRHFVSQIQDITEKKRAEEQRVKLEAQLRQAQKMEAIGTLAGGIAHDFNNILAGVMGNLQLAELDLSPGHPAAQSVREATRASRRARDLISRILTFSRRSEALRVPTRLGPIIEETVQLLRATLPASIDILTDIAPACPLVRCDSAQIHQIVLNLGGNAVAAMRQQGGRLTIGLRHGVPDARLCELHPQVTPHHVVRLTVRDTGHGMPAEVRERIFEPFFTTKGPGEGTGLGLAVVHGIVQDLGGAVVVESGVGEGTSFDLFFPACSVEAPLALLPARGATRPPQAVRATATGERILVVDDDSTVLAVATSILRRDGYRPEPFASPTKAVAAFAADPTGFALVISDLTMPEQSGFELARRIRELNAETPVVIASGYLDEESMMEFQSLGLAARLQKPYDVAALLSKVREVLERRPALT